MVVRRLKQPEKVVLRVRDPLAKLRAIVEANHFYQSPKHLENILFLANSLEGRVDGEKLAEFRGLVYTLRERMQQNRLDRRTLVEYQTRMNLLLRHF